MQNTISKVFEGLSERIQRPENEFLGEDGLLYCSTCKSAVQTVVSFMGIEKKVRCICECKKKERDAENERLYKIQLESKRAACFLESNMHTWTFANDDRQNPRLSDAMQRYVEQFDSFVKTGKGLLLYGPCGTGKSFYAACIANQLIDNGHTVRMTNFATLTNQLQGMFDGKQNFINQLNQCALLIIDDLGAERSSEYMQEMVFNIIDSRYRSGLPFIITTNLTPDEIKKPQNIGRQRIYDRILERCFPIEVSGVSRRRTALKESFSDVKKMLGL